MNHPDLFNLDDFRSLSGSELVHYAEPFLTTRAGAIPESVYGPLQSGLANLDTYHTVYALEICMLLKPLDFIGRVAGYLSHDDSSLCCTAYRLIKGIDPLSMPEELVGEIAATPIVELFTPDVRTGEKIRIGSNEGFIRDLVAGFASRPTDRARSGDLFEIGIGK